MKPEKHGFITQNTRFKIQVPRNSKQFRSNAKNVKNWQDLNQNENQILTLQINICEYGDLVNEQTRLKKLQ